MANISITFTTSARQDAKLAKMLAWVNAQRLVDGEAAYADVTEYGRAVLIATFQSWVRDQDLRDDESLTDAYNAATPAVQAQVDALLPR